MEFSSDKVEEEGMIMERQDITLRTEAKEGGVKMIRAQWKTFSVQFKELTPGG